MKITRESNIELLRIVAMFMILGLHVNMFALDLPEKEDIIANPIGSFARFFFENLCIIGVNIFVLISGWFGIKFKTKGLCSFLFQSLFFSIVIFLPFALSGNIELNKINILSSLLLYKNAYWFVWAYLILYILSPILNSFIENTDRLVYTRLLILFFSAQTIIFIFTPCGFFHNGGYDPLLFIGLYLLMAYIRRYPIDIKKYQCFLLWFFCVLANTSLCSTGNSTLATISLAYTNPLNIIGAAALVLFFTKISIRSNFINNIAVSCFAVYLFHSHFCVIEYYKLISLTIFNKYGGILYFVNILLFICLVFAIAVIIDKLRIFTFNQIWKFVENRKNVTQ